MLYLDTADEKEIEKNVTQGICVGVTTNPTILNRNNLTVIQAIEMLEKQKIASYFLQINGETYEAMMLSFKEIEPQLNSKVGVKIPVTMEGIKAYQTIRENYPDLCLLGTVVYDAMQGILAAQVGFDLIAVYYNRIEINGADPRTVVADIAKYIKNNDLKSRIMAASFRTKNQVKDAFLAGAHTCTVAPQIYRDLFVNTLTETDVRQFSSIEDSK